MSAIRVVNLTHRFGGVEAVKDVSFDAEERKILSIIGPNGAGKTTLFNVLTGLYPVQTGGIDIEGAPARKPLDALTVVEWALVALTTAALGVAVAVDVQALFTAFVEGWRGDGAGSAAWGHIAGRAGAAWIGGVACGGIALAACWVLWARSRGTPDVVAGRGVARTFQNLRLFSTMSVRDHVRLVYEWSPRRRRDVRGAVEQLLSEMGLQDVANLDATSLPYARQRRVEIARALATSPRILLLDEPAAGMTPTEAGELVELLKGLNRKGLTIILIEHRMKVVMGLSDHVVVLDHGAKIAEGKPHDVARNPHVIEAYLGTEQHG